MGRVEAWLESIPGEENASAVHYPSDDDFSFDDAIDEYRGSDSDQTAIEQYSDSNRTAIEQQSNSIQTIIKRRNQTAAARLEKDSSAKNVTPAQYLRSNFEIAALLSSPKFIKACTGRRRLKYIFSTPDEIRVGVRKQLQDNSISNYRIDKVWFAIHYNRRFSPLAFWSVVVASSILCFTIMLYPKQSKAKVENNIVRITPTKETRHRDSLYIREWSLKNKYQFTEYRYGEMLTDSAFVYGNKSARESIMKRHADEQSEAMKKKKQK